MRGWILIAAGSVMALASLPHALLGWPVLRAALVEKGCGEDLIGALGVGWHFGSAMMLTLGTIVVLSGWRARRIPRGPLWVPLVAGCGYALFGAAAILHRHLNTHFLFFLILGLLVALASLPWPRRGGAGSAAVE